jgi:hypothetical protein
MKIGHWHSGVGFQVNVINLAPTFRGSGFPATKIMSL